MHVSFSFSLGLGVGMHGTERPAVYHQDLYKQREGNGAVASSRIQVTHRRKKG